MSHVTNLLAESFIEKFEKFAREFIEQYKNDSTINQALKRSLEKIANGALNYDVVADFRSDESRDSSHFLNLKVA